MVKKEVNKLVLRDPIEVNIVDQIRKDMEAYAEEVVSNRAVVSIYGFKPVHMLLLYCAYATTGLTQRTKKCARLIGDMLGIYHPHGDVSTYDAILTLVNWYDCYMPLFKKQGNFGNYQGDGPASYRYTETMLTPFAMDCVIGDLTKTDQVVDWIKNYDESAKQPVFLPLKVPLLLINGTDGIAVGMKADIPSHNITEVLDATINLIDDPNYQVVLRPDHCMPCEIVDTNWKAISNKGDGKYIVRGVIEQGTYQGYPALFVKSLPNKTRWNPIQKAIEELKFTHLPQILSIHEDCKPDKINCIIKFRRGTDLNYAQQMIYKKTNLQRSFRVNFEIYNPMTHSIDQFSYKSYLQFFIEFRKTTLFRLYTSLYQNKTTKIHALGMYIDLSHNQNLHNIILDLEKNKNKDDNEMVDYLVKKYKLTDLQASFAIHNDLTKISPYHVKKMEAELAILIQESDELYRKIVDENELVKDLRADLVRIREKYKQPRRCKIIKESVVTGIPEGMFKIIITENNFICKIDAKRENLPKFRNDKPKYILKTDNTDKLVIFDSAGKSYKLPVNSVTLHDNRSNGLDIRILVKDLTSSIVSMISEERLKAFSKKINPSYFLTCVSRAGLIKKMDLNDIVTASAKSSTYMKLDDGDVVQDIMIIPDTSDIIVYSKNKALRFGMDQVPLFRKQAKGNISMNTDYIDGVSIITRNTTDIVIITDKGYVNRFNELGFTKTDRAKVGSKVIKLHKDDFIKFIYGVNIRDSLRVISNSVDKIVPVADIPEGSSVSPGTKMIPTREIVLRCSVVKN